MKKRVADIVVETLIDLGVKDCFSVVGGGAMHLNNAFVLKKDKIRTIYNHHEQACTMAAEGYARLSGGIAAVCVTSGPGGTNAINGVQGAWVDSLPIFVVSGHPRYDTTVPYEGVDIRARGVQENDIIGQVSTITKYAKMVLEPNTIRYEIQKAYRIALDGRRGPVWLSIPLNVQGALVEEDDLLEFDGDFGDDYTEHHLENSHIKVLQEMLNEAKRPCILTGSGIRTGNAEILYREFLNGFDIPIVGGNLQADVNYNGEKNYYGMSGTIGPRAGNFILQSADFILVLANSLSYGQTGYVISEFAPNAKIVMVDAEEGESKKKEFNVDLCINCDIKEFFSKSIEQGLHAKADSDWKNHCESIFKSFDKFEMLVRHGEFDKNERVPVLMFWKEFINKMQNNAVVNLGNSCSVHGILQEGVNYPEQRVLVNYKCGSMGDDITEAIGSAAYHSDVPQYCVTGEGSVMMNLQEFQTIHHYNLPIKTVIFNNDGYGGIRKTCESFFGGLYNGCTPESGVSFPDFEDVAKTFKIPFRRCKNIDELNDALDWIIAHEGNCILEIYERIDEIRGPRLESIMDENGKFITPPLHKLSPLIDDELIDRLIIKD